MTFKYTNEFFDGFDFNKEWLKKFDNCLFFTSFDKDFWDKMSKSSPKIKDAIKEGKSIYEDYDKLLFDMFLAFYRNEPRFIEKNLLSNNVGKFNKQIIDQIMKLSKYEELRTYTRNDEITSGLSTLQFHDEIKEKVKELVNQLKKEKEQLEQLMKEMIESLQSGGSGGEGQTLSQDQIDALQELLDKINNTNVDQNLKNELIKASQDALNKAQEMEQAQISWGLHKNDSFQTLDFENKLKLINKLTNSTKLKEITKFLGRIMNLYSQGVAESVKTKIKSLLKVKQGNDLTRIVPSEIVNLANPKLRPLFAKKYANRQLTQYEYNTESKLIKGPIVMCLDESGSMSGDREIKMKAAALATIQISQMAEQKRSVYVVHFAHNYSPQALKVHEFKKSESLNIDKLIECAEFFYNGGTNFEPPLKRAMSIIEEDKECSMADILFITDGECDISDKFEKDFKKWKQEKNVNCVSILIGGAWGYETLCKFSNKVHRVEELTEEFVVDNLSIHV